ncbi:MAG: ATP-binding protein, partial [Firmicutes bacterium]|nr:ATP-binding protein [Bacillota bacterium]
LIEQVLMNLIENAVYHSGATKPIVCKVENNETDVLIRVIDFGTGIDPERLSNIFDGTVYSENHTSDGHKGMGIGLSICKAIIIAHGGQISARNHADGAEFYFSLPKEESNDGF